MAELTPTFQLQLISWAENLFGTLTEDPLMLLSSQVTTVNMYSGLKLLNISGLNSTIQVVLSTVGIDSNATDDELACDRTQCMNRYDIAQQSTTACAELISSAGYSCIEHFCPDCSYAGFCDDACGLGLCANKSARHPVVNVNHTSVWDILQ